jgi:hypothetical protein
MTAPSSPEMRLKGIRENSVAPDCAELKWIWGVPRDGFCFSVPNYFFLGAMRQVGARERPNTGLGKEQRTAPKAKGTAANNFTCS